MDGRRMGARAVLLVVLGAWHAIVLFALMPRPQREVAGPGFVSVMLRLDPVRQSVPPTAPRLQLAPAPQVPWQSLSPEPISPVPEDPSASAQGRNPGAGIDWRAEAARAARSAAEAAPPAAEDQPAGPSQSYWTRRHEKGEQVPAGSGKWLVWVSEHCYTIVDVFETSTPGRPMSVRCPQQKPPIDAEVLSKRRPRYLDVPTPDAAP